VKDYETLTVKFETKDGVRADVVSSLIDAIIATEKLQLMKHEPTCRNNIPTSVRIKALKHGSLFVEFMRIMNEFVVLPLILDFIVNFSEGNPSDSHIAKIVCNLKKQSDMVIKKAKTAIDKWHKFFKKAKASESGNINIVSGDDKSTTIQEDKFEWIIEQLKEITKEIDSPLKK
jgi:hypothetical protein